MAAEQHPELDRLRDLVQLEDDAGRPVVLTVTEPLTPHGQRLADSLGVQVRVVTAAVSAHVATASSDCARPGCALEADPGQPYCRHHMTPPQRRQSMECKIEGCENQAHDERGMYARLCATHKAEAREQRASAPPPDRSSQQGGASLASRARKLVPLATKLDRARARLAALPEQSSAKSAFDEASRRASQSPTPDNLARVGESLKQLVTTAPKRTKLENDVAQAERSLGIALQSFARESRAA